LSQGLHGGNRNIEEQTMYGKILRAGALAFAVAAFTAPGYAQTNTNSGTMQKDETDVNKEQSGQPMTKGASPAAPRATTGGSSNPGTIDSGGAHIQGGQQGATPGTVGATPGAPSGAPANPCTPELKAQNRC
jgi:hypothetical protein